MPPANRRHEPSPEELARQIADQLAHSKPTTPRFSLGNSVLVGRLIAGVTALVSVALVVAGLVAGVSWLLDRTTGPHTGNVANTVEQNDASRKALADGATATRADGTLLPLVPLIFPTPLSGTSGSVDQPGPTAVTNPPATTTTTTTTTTPTSTTSNPVVSTSMPTTTTQPPTTTTLPATTTTTPATTTTSSPTTTTTEPTTTTTRPTSTTTTTTRPSPPSTPGQGG